MKLARDYWEGTLRTNPRWATSLGDRSMDALLEDPRPEAKAAEVARLEKLLEGVKRTDRAKLSEEEKLTLRALELQVRNDLDQLACGFEERNGDPLRGPAVEKAVTQLDDLLARPLADWPLLRPAREPHDDWPESERARFARDLETAVSDDARPAFERYRALLKDEVLPSARPPELSGVSQI